MAQSRREFLKGAAWMGAAAMAAGCMSKGSIGSIRNIGGGEGAPMWIDAAEQFAKAREKYF